MGQLLTTRDPQPPDQANLIGKVELEQPLEATTRIHRSRVFHKVQHDQALLLCLWDSGFGINELLSLKVRDVTFLQDSVQLRLDSTHPGLKSGTRTVELMECAPALKAWLALHPRPEPDRYVFITRHSDEGAKQMRVNTANDLMHTLAAEAGLFQHTAKGLSCHDIRHSSATRRAHWGEAQLRLFHGWARDSDMPARYVHKDMEDLARTVGQDAGIDELSLPQRVDVGTKTCPMCAEDIKAAARKCRYCGELVEAANE